MPLDVPPLPPSSVPGLRGAKGATSLGGAGRSGPPRPSQAAHADRQTAGPHEPSSRFGRLTHDVTVVVPRSPQRSAPPARLLGRAALTGPASWDLANLYLLSCDAEPLSADAPEIIGLSQETTCFVSMQYFSGGGRFEDVVVHEAAHIFHNSSASGLGSKARGDGSGCSRSTTPSARHSPTPARR